MAAGGELGGEYFKTTLVILIYSYFLKLKTRLELSPHQEDEFFCGANLASKE
jgi:hypothetical protein